MCTRSMRLLASVMWRRGCDLSRFFPTSSGIVPVTDLYHLEYRAGAGRASVPAEPTATDRRVRRRNGSGSEVVPNGKASVGRGLAELYLKAPEVTRRNTACTHSTLERAIVREVGYGLSSKSVSGRSREINASKSEPALERNVCRKSTETRLPQALKAAE